MKFLTKNPLRVGLIGLIQFYRAGISPFLGVNCRFSPTCSGYALQLLREFPIHLALWYSAKRVLKCHPFCSGGEDPVPQIPKGAGR